MKARRQSRGRPRGASGLGDLTCTSDPTAAADGRHHGCAHERLVRLAVPFIRLDEQTARLRAGFPSIGLEEQYCSHVLLDAELDNLRQPPRQSLLDAGRRPARQPRGRPRGQPSLALACCSSLLPTYVPKIPLLAAAEAAAPWATQRHAAVRPSRGCEEACANMP